MTFLGIKIVNRTAFCSSFEEMKDFKPIHARLMIFKNNSLSGFELQFFLNLIYYNHQSLTDCSLHQLFYETKVHMILD